jgi:hypothetical protein
MRMIIYLFNILTILKNVYVVYVFIITKDDKKTTSYVLWGLNLNSHVLAHVFNIFKSEFNFLSISTG